MSLTTGTWARLLGRIALAALGRWLGSLIGRPAGRSSTPDTAGKPAPKANNSQHGS